MTQWRTGDNAMSIVFNFFDDGSGVDTADIAPACPETVSMIEHVRECNRLELEISRLHNVIVNMARFGFETYPDEAA